MKLDIVIPMYNGEQYINGLFNAFREQTSDNFRLIVVNDGSTDKTSNLLHDTAYTHDIDILILEQINFGVGVARNYGAMYATNDLITFFDADDLPEKNYVETIISAFLNNEVDAFIFQRVSVDIFNNKINTKSIVLNDGIYSNEKLLYSMFTSEIDVCVFTIALKRNVLFEHNLKCPENCRNLEDVNFSYQMIAASSSIFFSNTVIYKYLIQSVSATTKYNVFNDWKTSVDVMDSLKNIFDSYNLNFSKTYRKWGTSRIIWTITWQSVCISESYLDFIKFASKINAKHLLVELFDFPKKYVSFSARLFCTCPILYYFMVKLIGKKKNRSSISCKLNQ